MPKLTVVLPVFNAMPFLPLAVESILGQTLKDFIFVLIDDGSTDQSLAYLQSLKDLRIILLHQENKGLGATFNRALELCETEFIARMDADDVALPERLARQQAYLDSHPEVVMLGSQLDFLVDEKRLRGSRMPLDHAGILKMFQEGRWGVSDPTLMLRTGVLKSLGGCRISRSGHELDFSLRMCQAGKAANLEKVLHLLRIHDTSMNFVSRNEMRQNYAYSLECYWRRQRGTPEPSFEEFASRWKGRGKTRRILEKIDDMAVFQYRKALIDFARGRKLKAGARMALAAACRPGAAIKRAMGLLGRFKASNAGS